MQKSRVYLKSYNLSEIIVPFLSIIFIILLLVMSKTAFDAALSGIKLWLWTVFPALFPFFVGSDILNSTGFVRKIGRFLEPIMRPLFNVPGCGAFAFAMGISSGYPVGAKITADMRGKGLLTKSEAERLLCFTNNSGPLFMSGAVAVGMFNNPKLGLLFLVCHYIACITVGVLFRFYKSNCDRGTVLLSQLDMRQENRPPVAHDSFTQTFGNAVKDSVNLLLAIGGFIIIFSVIINLLLHSGLLHLLAGMLSPILAVFGIDRTIIMPILSGLFEITIGTNLASKAVNVPLIQQLCAASFIIGWAGLSVHSQVASIISKTDISPFPYLAAKFLQGIFAAIYTFMFLKSGNIFATDTYAVFNPSEAPSALNSLNYAVMSVLAFVAVNITLLLVSFLLSIFNKKRRKRAV